MEFCSMAFWGSRYNIICSRDTYSMEEKSRKFVNISTTQMYNSFTEILLSLL